MPYGIYLQKKSPYYWVRFYDILEPDPQKKRKSINTKILVTQADLVRHANKEKIQGTAEVREMAKGFRAGLNERNILAKTGVKIKHTLKLSQGFQEFKLAKSVPDKKGSLKKKTLDLYAEAVNHLVKAAGDKPINKYNDKDYDKLLFRFESLESSLNTKSIYTRSLVALWEWFIEKKYAPKNIIEATDGEDKDPDPIPADDLIKILNELKTHKRSPHHFQIIYFMLLTGCRPSSAIVQLKENIFFKEKKIKIQNVKTGRRKKKPFYWFPLYKELFRLVCDEMKVKGSGRLFDMFSVCPDNYTYPLNFWDLCNIKLVDEAEKLKPEERIRKRYILKQIRPTFISFCVNVLKMDIYIVSKLADHADIKITDKSYVDLKLNAVRTQLDDIALEMFLSEYEEE